MEKLCVIIALSVKWERFSTYNHIEFMGPHLVTVTTESVKLVNKIIVER